VLKIIDFNCLFVNWLCSDGLYKTHVQVTVILTYLHIACATSKPSKLLFQNYIFGPNHMFIKIQWTFSDMSVKRMMHTALQTADKGWSGTGQIVPRTNSTPSFLHMWTNSTPSICTCGQIVPRRFSHVDKQYPVFCTCGQTVPR